MNLSMFRESLDKQKEGSPIYVGDSVFYVRRWGTPESQVLLKDLRKLLFGPFHKAQDGDDSKLAAEWLCWAVTGWDDVSDCSGEVSFDEVTARNIFTNPEFYQSLNSVLIAGAMNFENYLHDESEQDTDALKKK